MQIIPSAVMAFAAHHDFSLADGHRVLRAILRAMALVETAHKHAH
jgi:hypothetical protein